MGHRPSLTTQRAALSAEAYSRIRQQSGLPAAVTRMMLVGVVIDELQQIVDMSMENMGRYGEITDGTDKAIRLRVRDLYRNVVGDVPTNDTDMSLAAD